MTVQFHSWSSKLAQKTVQNRLRLSTLYEWRSDSAQYRTIFNRQSISAWPSTFTVSDHPLSKMLTRSSRLNTLYPFHLVPKVKLFRKIRKFFRRKFNCFVNSQKQFCLLYYMVSLLILHHALAGNQSSNIPNILKVHH